MEPVSPPSRREVYKVWFCLQSVAGRLGLPALAPDAGLESVDAMAAAIVAAGPLTGAAMSLVLDAILPATRAASPPTRAASPPTRCGDCSATSPV